MTVVPTQERRAGPPPLAGPDPGNHRAAGPSALLRLHVEGGQSPWLDHLTREQVLSGSLSRLVAAGVRGITANPAALAVAPKVPTEDDEQLSWLLAACDILRPTYETSQAEDGFVSIEESPAPGNRTPVTGTAARRLHERIATPNLLVAIPATTKGVSTAQAALSAGRSINATSIFSIGRYGEVVDAYQSGLERLVANDGDPASVHGVASFSVGPVDAEVDRRLERLGGRAALELRGLAAVAQARLAYRLFQEWFSTARWSRLANRGAKPQRLLWTSAGTDLDTDQVSRYVTELIAPSTIHSLPEPALTALLASGAGGTGPDFDMSDAAGLLSELAAAGIDLDDVGVTLESRSAARARDPLAGVLDRQSTRCGQR